MDSLRRTADLPPWALWALSFLVAGCACQAPYVGQGPHPQIERGQPVLPIDTVANVLSIPWKILLLEWRYGNHCIRPRTEDVFVRYLAERQENVSHTKIRLNQYAPHKDVKRLIRNRQVAWPYRLLFGVPLLLVECVLPGRIFGGFLFSDYYNPWTDTIHLFSDSPAIGLHELGHAYDFGQQPYRGTYGLMRNIPVVVLHQEWQATDEAISYLVEIGDRRNELRAYQVLYPAYGGYLGSYVVPFGNLPGILLGHVVGRVKAKARARFYRELDRQNARPVGP